MKYENAYPIQVILSPECISSGEAWVQFHHPGPNATRIYQRGTLQQWDLIDAKEDGTLIFGLNMEPEHYETS